MSQPDLFGRLVYERRAEIPAGTVFSFGGLEEMTDRCTLKGQLALWSADGVSRAMRGRR